MATALLDVNNLPVEVLIAVGLISIVAPSFLIHVYRAKLARWRPVFLGFADVFRLAGKMGIYSLSQEFIAAEAVSMFVLLPQITLCLLLGNLLPDSRLPDAIGIGSTIGVLASLRRAYILIVGDSPAGGSTPESEV